jgi:hypothetical protein
MKIYARQVSPECQEPPLFLGEEFFPEDIILDGNRDYKSHTIPAYDRIIEAYDEAAQEIENLDLKNGYAAYKNATEAINDYFPALEYRGKPYSSRDIHRIREALRLYGSRKYYEGDYILDMLEAITGEAWSETTIRGCCQGDWQTVIYPVKNWNQESLATFETEYFNTGSEWIVHDGDADPDGPEDIDGYSVYCHGWKTEDIKREIAEAHGAADAEVILYEFTGYSYIPNYKEA